MARNLTLEEFSSVKKFTSNAAKKCIVAEYIVGGGGAKKEEAPKGPAKEAPKKKVEILKFQLSSKSFDEE
jgi:hypothetical protein